jgi:hypothetical protein
MRRKAENNGRGERMFLSLEVFCLAAAVRRKKRVEKKLNGNVYNGPYSTFVHNTTELRKELSATVIIVCYGKRAGIRPLT